MRDNWTGAKKTIVFLPIDAHGHTSPMLSLAAELRAFGYRTIFITYSSDIAKHYGHETVLLDECTLKIKQASNGLASKSLSTGVTEQDIYLNAKLFDHDWDEKRLVFNAELADGAFIDEISFRTAQTNFSLWPRMAEKALKTDKMLERVLIALQPQLVVTELTPMRPALVRLSREPYAKLIAGWSQPLRWMTLVSLGPTWIHYCGHLTRAADVEELQPQPPPHFGFPVKRRLNNEDYKVQNDLFKQLITSSGFLQSQVDLGRAALLSNIEDKPLTGSQIGSLLLNESSWLNVYMYPSELDYDTDYKSNLDRSRWVRVDALVRPTSLCSSDSEHLINRLVSWQQSKRENRSLKVIYIALGTVVSEDMSIMESVISQVLKCLEEQPEWRIAMALGTRYVEISRRFQEQFNLWQDRRSQLIVRGWWPQPEVFRRQLVDACVIHGGNNTFCEIFYFARPPPALVVIPGQGDQLDNARRVQEFDLGVVLPVAKMLRRTPSSDNKGNLLLDAMKQSLKLHRASGKKVDIDWTHPRLNAEYCAKLVHEKLEKENHALG